MYSTLLMCFFESRYPTLHPTKEYLTLNVGTALL